MGAGLVLLVVAGSFTGSLLRWDQLGLWAVSVGDDMRGFFPLFDDDNVRFVISPTRLGVTGGRWLRIDAGDDRRSDRPSPVATEHGVTDG